MFDIQDGKSLPKGATVLIMPYFMARDETIFENPLKFNPERYAMEKDSDDATIFGYVPFSGGYRNCIGQKFAMLEIKSTISKVLQNFEIQLPKNFALQESLELVIKSTNGVMLKLMRREV
jgi:cytochrome P450 family 4